VPPSRFRRTPRAAPARLACAALLAAAGVGVGAVEAVQLEAERLDVRVGIDAVATGDVRLRRSGLAIRADRLHYTVADDTAHASGAVRIEYDGDVFRGRELLLRLERFEGFFVEPDYFFARLQAGGRAERIDFIDRQRFRIVRGDYTSCPREDDATPDWLLSASEVKIDLERNEGRAEGAVLRFLGVPILAAPWLSFPVTDARKSGWLPPNFNIDDRSGVEFGVPYYWNIAPHLDATLVPTLHTRRGLSLGGEFRYLDADFRGIVSAHLLPDDRVARRTRSAFGLQHAGRFGAWAYRADVQAVSDDEYWKDFERPGARFTPRLLPREFELRRRLGSAERALEVYAAVQQWQVLQGIAAAPIVAPHQRSPQLGLRGHGQALGGLEYAFETEFNRFDRPPDANDTLPTGQRLHLLGEIAWPLRAPFGALVPRVAFNAAAYQTDLPMADGQRSAVRVIPTFSLDGTLVFERGLQARGRALRQSLEPRLRWANTPFRDQSALPNFDSAGLDFNEVTIFADDAFSGVDRVADAHQITAGLTTRVVDEASGVEQLRASVVQRYLLRDQFVTPDGLPLKRRLSDLLLSGSAALSPRWTFDAAARYSPDLGRTTRAIAGVRFSPGPFRTLSLRYRFAHDLSEQVETGWQWPLFGPVAGAARAAGDCRKTVYAVGRLSYSLRERQLTDALLGVEIDSGCWIARVVTERRATERGQARSRIMLQLELVGLSRLGINPLAVLRDNIPGYRLLREPTPTLPPPRNHDSP
jgi:LPS-assembly protein